MNAPRLQSPVASGRSNKTCLIGHVLIAMSIAGGCAKRAAESSAPGADMDGGDELAQLEQQLAQRELQLHAAGYRSRAAGEATSTAGALPDPARDAGDRKPEAQRDPPSSAPSEPAPMAGSTSRAPVTKQAEAEDLEGGGSCQQVCEIGAAICALEDRICGLVPRHQDDPRYQAACSRAAEDCRFATEACHACT